MFKELGEPRCRASKDEWVRLPCVTELFPQLLDEGIEEDDTPSCSVRGADSCAHRDPPERAVRGVVAAPADASGVQG